MKKVIVALLSMVLAGSIYANSEFKGGTGKFTIDSREITYTFKNGKFEGKDNNGMFVKGTYFTKGKYLIITDIEGERACIGNDNAEVGIYTWETYDGQHHLKVIDDVCGGRQRGFLRASPLELEEA